ncbi:MAG: nitroreductase family protein [Bacillota bacterium]|nr:nitroreductase family protein [Bacillota bacterium]
MNRASVRQFEPREVPREVVERLARAGQQAPFTGQMYSLVVTGDPEKRRRLSDVFGPLVLRAPLFMLVCIDFRKLERFIAYRGRTNRTDDLGMLFVGIQDASYAAQNIVLAAEAEGLGSCFLGAAPFRAADLIPLFKLPKRVYPLVGLVLGYPAERPAARPRIPLDNCLFWEEYQDLSEQQVAAAMAVMDAGLIREGYYAKLNAKIPLVRGDDPVGYDEYGWSEHVSRKYGERGAARAAALLDTLRRQGVNLGINQGVEEERP